VGPGGDQEFDASGVLARQRRALAAFSLGTPWARSFLDNLAVVRVDVEMVPQGIAFGHVDRPVSCYLPWTYVTGGGHCPVARLSDRRGRTICARGCRGSTIELTYPTPTWRLLQVGHTVFSPMVSLLPRFLSEPAIDRFVLETGIPM